MRKMFLTEQQTYSAVGPGSLREKVVHSARVKIFQILKDSLPIEEMESVLDVGVTADRLCAYSNFFEVYYPYPERITAFSDQDASWMCDEWKGLRFVQGDARQLPFADGSFDLVFSSAVIEHVGSREQQAQFLSECIRVARRHVFLTTPNRWFPLEMHSGLPIVHWLPDVWFRCVLRCFGFHELAKESNLNLLTARDLVGLCNPGQRNNIKLKIRKMWFCGFPSNLLLHIEKKYEN